MNVCLLWAERKTGCSLGNVHVPRLCALILDNEDEVKTRQDGGLQVNILLCALQVIIPVAPSCINEFVIHPCTKNDSCSHVRPSQDRLDFSCSFTIAIRHLHIWEMRAKANTCCPNLQPNGQVRNSKSNALGPQSSPKYTGTCSQCNFVCPPNTCSRSGAALLLE